jgi:hypothetical protein
VRFVTDPKLAKEVVMADGTKYPVSPTGGSFVVTDSKHVSELERGNHDYFTNAISFGGKGRECPCGRLAWHWDRSCPRCGQPLPE